MTDKKPLPIITSSSPQRTSFPQPPWSGLGKRLESMVRKALYDFEMIPTDGSPLAIALSGGKDSLGMLFMLHAIRGRGFPPFEIIAIHVRGQFSCGASTGSHYLSSLCQAMNVPLVYEESTKTLDTLECYSCSRERRALIFRAAQRLGAHTIAFGHHRDDNTETLLMNLLHKGEFCGLMPKIFMRTYAATIVRPMIYVTKNDLATFAEQHGFLRITCQCPVGQNSMRKTTAGLLDTMEAIYPHARENLASSALKYGSKKALE